MNKNERKLQNYLNEDDNLCYSNIARNGLKSADEFKEPIKYDVLRHYVNKVKMVKDFNYNKKADYKCDHIVDTKIDKDYVKADIIDATKIEAKTVKARLIDATKIEAEEIECVVLDASSVEVNNLDADLKYCTCIKDLE